MKLLAVILLFAGVIQATLRIVPDNYSSIQMAVDSSFHGDTVLIRPGVYNESLLIHDWDLTIAGEFLLSGDTTSISETQLYPEFGGGTGRCIYADSSILETTLRIVGLTVRRGNGYVYEVARGGGLWSIGRHLIIEHCVFDSCVGTGGAIYTGGASATIMDSRFLSNGTERETTNIVFNRTNAEISGCTFENSFGMHEGVVAHLLHISEPGHYQDCQFKGLGWIPETSNVNLIQLMEDVSEFSVQNCEIDSCRINMGIASFPAQEGTYSFNGNYIHDNTVFNQIVGTQVSSDWSQIRIQINGNIFENNRHREGNFAGSGLIIISSDPTSTRSIVVSGNLFLNNIHRDNACGVISGFWDSTAITRNYFIENEAEGFLWPPGGALAIFNNEVEEFTENVFHDNHGFAVHDHNLTGYAQNNYWGHESGPYHPTLNPFGQGDTVDTLIVFEPWEADTSFLQEAVDPPQPSVPTDFLIGRVYPNPFNSEIEIEYVVTGTHDVRLEIFDLLGRRVETLIHEQQQIGIHRARWSPADEASGIYFARLHAQNSPQPPSIMKLVYLK